MKFKQFLARYPLDPREKTKRRQRLLLSLTAAALLAAAFCLGALSLIFGSLYFVRPRLLSYFQTPMLAFLNILPVVLLVFLLYFLTNRAWLAFLLGSILILLGSFVNYYKVVLRDDSLVFEDLKLIGAAAGIAGEYQFDLSGWFVAAMVLCALGTVFLLIVCRGRLPQWRWRAGGIALILAASVASYKLWYDDKVLYEGFENYTLFNEFKPTEKYASRGFVYPFLFSIQDTLRTPPPGYSKKEAETLLSQRVEGEIPPGQKVNVICTMLESYADLSQFDLHFTKDPYAALRDIWAESYTGTLISDTMGGGTINAEHSFLTGYAYPHPSYRHKTESFAQYFARQGYTVEGAHPGYDWFYNRRSINKNLGFADYYFSDNLFQSLTDVEYAPDNVFFSAVRTLYDAADGPYFSFNVSYQGHSPYLDTAFDALGSQYISREGIDDATYFIANNYLGSVADTSARVAALIEALRDEETPVVLLFFGDHKPTLGASNGVYTALGIDLNRASEAGFENYYATPYFFWANDAAEQALGRTLSGTGPTISPCYLMAELFTQLGWAGTPYLQYLQEAAPVLPVRHSTGVVYQYGAATEELSENSQLILEKLEKMQYYLRGTTQK